MAEPSSRRPAADFTAYGLIPQIPDELSVQIIARAPRFSHPILALVSRSWRSFLRSSLLFTLRSQLAATEPSLCIHIHTHTLSLQSRWYLLNLHPCRLLPLPPLPFPTSVSACATIGPSLFVLGGSFCGAPSDAVQAFDACLGTWTTLPPMGVSRRHAAAGAIGGKLYVLGGCLPSSGSWAEVLDPTSGMWAPVPSPPHLRSETMCGSAVSGGRLVVSSEIGGLGFDPAASLPWDDAMLWIWEDQDGWDGHAAVVDGVIYFEDPRGNIRGYDTAADKAEEKLKWVDGLDGILNVQFNNGQCGGLLCLVWKRSGSKELEIDCAGIMVTRMSGVGLWGSVVWRESSPTPIRDASWMKHCVTLEF